MKEKVIELAGKTWQTLGLKGEISPRQLAKVLNEKEDIVNQAIGWLAREDKIHFSTKRNKTVVSLVQAEFEAFKNLYNRQKAARKTRASSTVRKKKISSKTVK